MGVPSVDAAGGRRLEFVAIGLPLHRGVPLGIDAKMVAPLHAYSAPWPHAAEEDGAAIIAHAEKVKARTYLELVGSVDARAPRCDGHRCGREVQRYCAALPAPTCGSAGVELAASLTHGRARVMGCALAEAPQRGRAGRAGRHLGRRRGGCPRRRRWRPADRGRRLARGADLAPCFAFLCVDLAVGSLRHRDCVEAAFWIWSLGRAWAFVACVQLELFTPAVPAGGLVPDVYNEQFACSGTEVEAGIRRAEKTMAEPAAADFRAWGNTWSVDGNLALADSSTGDMIAS